MTLSKILKKYGIKVRGLQPAIERWSYADRQPTIKWYESYIKETTDKQSQLEKLNSDLHAQCNKYREEAEKFKAEIEGNHRAIEHHMAASKKKTIELSEYSDNLFYARKHITVLKNRINELELRLIYVDCGIPDDQEKYVTSRLNL